MRARGTVGGVARIEEAIAGRETDRAVRTVLYELDRADVWRAIAEHAAQTLLEHHQGTRSYEALRRLTVVAADLADLLGGAGEDTSTR